MGFKAMLLVLSLGPVLLGAPRGPNPREVLKLSRSRDANDRLRAARLLAEMPGRTGTALLIELLGDVDAEVRQRAFAGLTARRRPEDLERIAMRGLAHPRPAARRAALDLLVAARAPGLTENLARGLEDRDPGVREAAVNATVNFLGCRGLPLLTAAVSRGREGRPRAAALLALHEIDPDGSPDRVARSLTDRAFEVRVAALELTESFGALVRALRDESWSVRLTAIRRIEAAAEIRGVPALIEALRRERGRLREEASRALAGLTGVGLPPDADRWAAWWAKEKDRFRVPERPAKPPAKRDGSVATFHSIPVVSRSVAFVLDRSRSMRQRIARGVEKRKGEMVEEELAATLARLPSSARFYLVAFRTEPAVFHPRTLPPTPGARRKALDWLRSLEASGRTNLYDALARALSVPEVDTICLLTDGAPSAGEHRERAPILRAVSSLNRYRKAVVHTVEIGGGTTGKKWVGFLEELAARTGGRYVRK